MMEYEFPQNSLRCGFLSPRFNLTNSKLYALFYTFKNCACIMAGKDLMRKLLPLLCRGGYQNLIRNKATFAKEKRRSSFRMTDGSSNSSKNAFQRVGLNGWIILIVPISTFGLGTWQVFRWRWKLNLIEQMEKLSRTQTIEFSELNSGNLQEYEYKKVCVRGHFDTNNDVLLGPRSLISGPGESKSQGLISQGSNTSSGYLVLTPFTVAENNVRIIVNRGWISSRKVQNYPANKNEVEIVGVVRLSERRSPFMRDNKPGSGLWMFRDLPSLATYFQSSELFLDLIESNVIDKRQSKQDEETRLGQIPIPCQTRVTLRNEHVSYFVTWFSLSAITGYMWYKMHILRKPLH